MFWKKKEPEDYVAKKDYKKAIMMYRERLSEQPTNTALRLNIADTLLLDKQLDAAIREYKNIANDFTESGYIMKAIALYKKILKFRPDLPEIEHLLHHLSEHASLPEHSHSHASEPAPPKDRKKQEQKQVGEIETKLLKGLKPAEVRHIVSKLQLHHFDTGSVVVKEGDPGNSLFILVKGEVRVTTKSSPKGEVFLATLGDGEFFGEIALLTGKPRTATIVTIQPSDLLELNRNDYKEITAKYPSVKKVVEDFHLQRANKTIEALIQALHTK